MKNLYILLILVVILGVSSLLMMKQGNLALNNQPAESLGEIDETDLQWKFTVEESLADVARPLSRVILNVKHQKDYALGKFSGSCSRVDNSKWPKDQISGILCWWAGGGDEIRVVSENGKYLVKHRVVDEGTSEEAGFQGEFTTLVNLD